MDFDVSDGRHDGSSSPVYGSAPSVRRSGIGALGSIVTEQPYIYARGHSHRHRTVAVVTTPSPFANPLPSQDYQSAIPPGFAIHQSAAAILRAARLRDLLASIAEWERASGPERVWWRRDARHRLAEWRRLHREPEMRAFRAAVAAAQHRRTA